MIKIDDLVQIKGSNKIYRVLHIHEDGRVNIRKVHAPRCPANKIEWPITVTQDQILKYISKF